VVTGLAANRIDRPGAREEAWRSWPDLRRLPPADAAAWPSVVVVAAHPDDEVLGTGGTMAILAAAGARLRLIAVTDGEGSHPGSDPAVIGSLRIAESAAALDLLGAREAEVIRLRLPDTVVAFTRTNWPACCASCAPGSTCAWRRGKVTCTPTTRPRAAPRAGRPAVTDGPC